MKNRKFIDSLKYSINGIITALQNERNMRIHFAIGLIAIILGFILKLNSIEFLILILAIIIVIVCEIFNSAIELICDLMIDIKHPTVKKIKDMSAGAVLLSSLGALVIGFLLFFIKIFNLFFK